MKILAGILSLIVTILLEYNFATWLHGLIVAAIPNNEWHDLLIIIAVIAHVILLGGIYIGILAFVALLFFREW